ncbi:hypothetical protein FH972_021446 [Carpinus fangiana]|uniref:Uncharacterized protein n=1 Tax=Carpinus fangiana TaxID=176857 RepID=A0A5N6KPC4_9ROSI|nr:hypothetical protein FH972_021446 [Carpinus fangiana]
MEQVSSRSRSRRGTAPEARFGVLADGAVIVRAVYGMWLRGGVLVGVCVQGPQLFGEDNIWTGGQEACSCVIGINGRGCGEDQTGTRRQSEALVSDAAA